MPDILALCAGESRRILEEQLRKIRAEVQYLETLDGLESWIMEADIKAVITDLFDSTGRPAVPMLRELQHALPELKIIVSYDPSPAMLDAVLDAATCGIPLAFAARGVNDLSLFLPPLLAQRSTRPPSAAASLVLRVVPKVVTMAARRCVTFGAVNPAHRLTLDTVARFCDSNPRTLHRNVERLASPKLLLNALAWPQASYLLTGLHWRPQHVAAFFGYRRPVLLIELLADYVESGLWRLGLDPDVDAAAANVATWSEEGRTGWLHRRKFRAGANRGAVTETDEVMSFEGVLWSRYRQHQIGTTILSMVDTGMSPIEVVRRLWTRYDMAPGHLYWGVMQLVHAVHSRGLIENA